MKTTSFVSVALRGMVRSFGCSRDTFGTYDGSLNTVQEFGDLSELAGQVWGPGMHFTHKSICISFTWQSGYMCSYYLSKMTLYMGCKLKIFYSMGNFSHMAAALLVSNFMSVSQCQIKLQCMMSAPVNILKTGYDSFTMAFEFDVSKPVLGLLED